MKSRPILDCNGKPPSEIASRLAEIAALNGPLILNVAGSRESKEPGIGARAEAYLAAVFRRCLEM